MSQPSHHNRNNHSNHASTARTPLQRSSAGSSSSNSHAGGIRRAADDTIRHSANANNRHRYHSSNTIPATAGVSALTATSERTRDVNTINIVGGAAAAPIPINVVGTAALPVPFNVVGTLAPPVPIPFRRYQTPATPFRPFRVRFPPPRAASVPAVWSWQLGEAEWVPFESQVSDLLETLWDEIQQEQAHQQQDEHPPIPEAVGDNTQRQPQERLEDQTHLPVVQHPRGAQLMPRGEPRQGSRPQASRQPLSHRVYVHLSPWAYSIDLDRMLQQNMSTHRVRPIRRSLTPASIWFVRGIDGYSERFDPMIESHLEDLHHQAIAGQTPRDALVATWQDPISGSLHFTDVVSMTDATDARPNAAREIVRVALMPPAVPTPPGPAGTGAEATTPDLVLPSLSVGVEETGKAFCRGHTEWVDPEECRAALFTVEGDAIPDDACAICLDTLRPVDSEGQGTDSVQRQHQRNLNSSTSSRLSRAMAVIDLVSASDGETSTVTPSSTSWSDSPSGDSSEVVKLRKCPHHFHAECIRLYLRSSSRGGFFCPTCNALQVTGNGPSPPGRMDWTITNRSMLSGHPGEGTIVIQYNIDGGVQTERHAQPNEPFTGTRRQAYLPDCLMGRQLLRLLIQAFVKGHLFTVGNSVTSGLSNVVIWNGIHHKTNVTGGLLHYGFPDETFLTRLADELRGRGFPLETPEATQSSPQATDDTSSQRLI